MDFNTINDISRINISKPSDNSDNSNFILNLTIFKHLNNIYTFIRIICKSNYCWALSIKYLFCENFANIWSSMLKKLFCKSSKNIDYFIKKNRDQNIFNSKNLETDNCNIEPTIINYSKNKCNFYMKNDFTKPSDDLSNLTKIMHKKLVQNDVNIRYELLKAEKKLLSQIKQTRELERTLRDVKEIVVQDRNYFQNKILNNCSSIIRKRTTFFGNSGSFTYSDMERNSFTTELEVIKDSTNTQWTGLEKYVNELKDNHLKEILSLHDKINNQDKIIKKIEESNITFIELYHKIQKEMVKLKHDDLLRSIKLQKLKLTKEFHEQKNTRLNHVNYELRAELHDSAQRMRRLNSTLMEVRQSRDDLAEGR